jgi:hypothetical protein
MFVVAMVSKGERIGKTEARGRKEDMESQPRIDEQR